MKIEALKEYIKKIVKQEIHNVLQEELRFQLTEIFLGGKGSSSNVSDVVKTSSTDVKNTTKSSKSLAKMLDEDVGEVANQEKPTKKFVKYTNNPLLNQVLNETTGGVPREGSMMGVGYSEPLNDGSGENIPLNEAKLPPNATEAQKMVHNIVNKDYRALLKAVDKKKGIK